MEDVIDDVFGRLFFQKVAPPDVIRERKHLQLKWQRVDEKTWRIDMRKQ